MPRPDPGPRRGPRVLALLLAGLLALASLLLAGPVRAADEPGDGQNPVVEDSAVTEAVLRWGVSNEANNSAFAPGTFNFFSAGKVPDPGRGGTTLNRADWRQAAGEVAIEKWNGRAWRAASWAGLFTAPDGTPLGSPTAGTFSGHQVVLSGGSGTVDHTTGTARIAWTGDFTVLLYSGMSFYYVSDPVLEVADGVGRLTGTLSGYGSSQADTSVWEKLTPARVTLADLPGLELGEGGFTADAAYAGVVVPGVGQKTDVAAAGCFPPSFMSFMSRVGTAAYWCSTGASTDAFKAALPVTVSYRAGVAAPAPVVQPGAPVVDNAAPEAPDPEVTTNVTASTGTPDSSPASPPAGVAPGAAVPAGVAKAVVAGTPAQTVPLSTPVRLVAAPVRPLAAAGTDRAWWLTGLGLLTLSGFFTVATLRRPPLSLLRPFRSRPTG